MRIVTSDWFIAKHHALLLELTWPSLLKSFPCFPYLVYGVLVEVELFEPRDQLFVSHWRVDRVVRRREGAVRRAGAVGRNAVRPAHLQKTLLHEMHAK